MTNEAAERLIEWMLTAENAAGEVGGPFVDVLDEALAAERRATVERIRTAARKQAVYWQGLDAILDEEAAR